MSEVRTAISGRFLNIKRPTGTHRSAKQLMLAVLKSIGFTCRVYAPSGSSFEVYGAARIDLHMPEGPAAHLWEQAIFPATAQARVIWTLMGTGPVFHPRKRHVMVVHDLNYEVLPHVFGRAFRTWYRFACGAAAQRADMVVCFTDYVKASIQERLGIPADRIRVIPQGPGLTGLDKPPESVRPQAPARPYFLCVGSLQPHKNLAGVLTAYEKFKQRHDGYALKVVGRAQGNFASLGVDLSRLPPDVEFTGYLSDEELIGLYRGATGFLYPSIEEGFGLPIVESFYCGCPVITSNRSCLPEVAGDAALLADPHNAKTIAEAMAVVVQNRAKAEELRSKGFERAKFFTWENAGRQMAKILNDMSSSERK